MSNTEPNFLLSLCQQTHSISSSHDAHRQNKSYTLSVASTNLNIIYSNLPTLIACVLHSCLVLSFPKITTKIQCGYLPTIDSLIELHFITKMIIKVGVRQNRTKICKKHSTQKSHFLFSLCQLTHSISFSHAAQKQSKKLHTSNRINKSQYNLSKSSHTDCFSSYF